MDEKAVIDRIEDGRHAVLLVGIDKTERIVPIEVLPEGAGPGAWLQVEFEDDVLVRAVIDAEETERVKQRIADKLVRLRQRGRRGRRSKREG